MNCRGFTLIELLIAISICAILLAFSAPALNEWLQKSNNNEVARDILSGLRHARSLAITDNQKVTASIDLDNHQLTYNGIVRDFSSHIKIEASDDGAVWEVSGSKSTIFEPQGSCTKLLFIRVNSDNKLIIQINSTATGLARF